MSWPQLLLEKIYLRLLYFLFVFTKIRKHYFSSVRLNKLTTLSLLLYIFLITWEAPKYSGSILGLKFDGIIIKFWWLCVYHELGDPGCPEEVFPILWTRLPQLIRFIITFPFIQKSYNDTFYSPICPLSSHPHCHSLSSAVYQFSPGLPSTASTMHLLHCLRNDVLSMYAWHNVL